MRHETTTLYGFHELTEAAQDAAIASWRDYYSASIGGDWHEEWQDTLHAAQKAMGWFRVYDWRVGACYSHVDHSTDVDWPVYAGRYYDRGREPLTGPRLARWLARELADDLARDCPWTGYCGDESFLRPIRDFIARPRAGVGLDDIMAACCESWASDWEADIEYQWSDECIRDSIEASGGDDFQEDGTYRP